MGARETKSSTSKPAVTTKIVKAKKTVASGKAKSHAKRTVN